MNTKPKTDTTGIKAQLDDLQQIVAWFESQENADVEKGLEQVKKASVLIKSLKSRLVAVENEFEEVKKSLED